MYLSSFIYVIQTIAVSVTNMAIFPYDLSRLKVTDGICNFPFNSVSRKRDHKGR